MKGGVDIGVKEFQKVYALPESVPSFNACYCVDSTVWKDSMIELEKSLSCVPVNHQNRRQRTRKSGRSHMMRC